MKKTMLTAFAALSFFTASVQFLGAAVQTTFGIDKNPGGKVKTHTTTQYLGFRF